MGGFSKARLGRVADLLAGSVQRGETAEVVALPQVQQAYLGAHGTDALRRGPMQ